MDEERLRRSVDRYYMSMSVQELRQSDSFPGASRLPYNTVLYLDLIYFHPGCTVSRLAEILGVTKATVTMTVNRLEAKGLVVRERSGEDGRVRNLRLSDELESEYRSYGRAASVMVSRMLERFGTDDVELFCSMLDYASDVLEGLEADGLGKMQ